MPKNKNAYLRLRLIDQCLRNKNKYFNRTALANKVSEKLGYTISINTIDKDLKALQDEFKAPIKFDKFLISPRRIIFSPLKEHLSPEIEFILDIKMGIISDFFSAFIILIPCESEFVS